MIAETEDDLIKRLNECKDFMENRGMRVKPRLLISGERQKVMQKAVRWPCRVCGRGVGNNSIQCTTCQKWVLRKCSGINGSMYTHTHTHRHTTVLLLFWDMSGTTRVSRYQKGKTRKVKTNLDLLEH